jgi:hypothetical protein
VWVSNPQWYSPFWDPKTSKEGPCGFQTPKPSRSAGLKPLVVWPSANGLDLRVSTACQLGFMSLCSKKGKKKKKKKKKKKFFVKK